MLEFRNVSFTYKNSEEKVLNNVSFKINEGECVLLTGISGSGKSTIVHLMNGLIPALYEGELTGKIYYNNTSLESIKTYDIAKDIGYVSQDPRGHFFTTNTTSELVFAMENFGISLDEMKKRYNAVVELLELEEIVDKNILYISSGERQKIAIGCSLTLIPRVIILDEPSSNLDFRMTKKLTILIEKLKNKGYTIIIAEHRIHYIQKLIDKVLIVNKGMIKEITIDDLKNTTDFPLRTLDIFNLQLENISSKNNDLLLQIDNISYGDILLQISTSINKGDVIGLIGRNGAGKTTLLRMLTNIMNPTKGKILGNVKPFLVMQDMDYQFFTESVLSEIRFGNEGVENDKINNLLEELGLNKFKDKIPFELSGGQKQRLLISIAAISNVNLLMFDEPTSGLDYVNMIELSRLIEEIAKNDVVIFIITHDYEFLCQISDEVLYFDKEGIKERIEVNEENKNRILELMS